MTMKCQHERNGELISYEWDWFVAGAMMDAATVDEEPGTSCFGEFTIKRPIRCFDKDEPEREIHFEVGDVIRIWRD